MQEIIAKINELFGMCEAKEKELSGLVNDAKITVAQQRAFADQLAAKEAELKEREAKVISNEEVIRISNETKDLADKLKVGFDELKVQRVAFEATMGRVAAEQSDRERAIAGKEDALKARENDLTKKEQDFDNKVTEAVKKILSK